MTTAPLSTETTPLVPNGSSSSSLRKSNSRKQWLLSLTCGILGVALGMTLMAPSNKHRPSLISRNTHIRSTTVPPSPYTKVQGLGFQIYTGGAPAFIKQRQSNDTSTTPVENPECLNLHSYGQNINGLRLECYIGHNDPIKDVKKRITIMKHAVERAYELSDKHDKTLKIFVAPEFYWRGLHGAYLFSDDEGDDDCGPICVLLQGMEELVASPQYKDWLFVFGSVVASEVLPKEDEYDYLFYNFAPVYKGYDPSTSSYMGKRFIVPKRYVSSSDFLTPRRHMNQTLSKELLDREVLLQDSTVFNPFDFQQKRYDNEMWIHYKEELSELGYAMIEYDWLMVDGLSMTIEICFDHDRRTALNSYLADIMTGSTTRIPSSTKRGLEYVPIPTYQAQISVVSSAGMTVIQDSLALTDNGTIFLQDGVNDDTGKMQVSTEECNKGGIEFEGGTEAVQRKAVLTPTDVFFEYKVRQDFARHGVFGDDWKEALKGSFSAEKYEPLITVYEPIDIAKVTP